jgi:hypothetical protein
MAPSLTTILMQPIPDQTAARLNKKAQTRCPVAAGDTEPVVDVALHGIAARRYHTQGGAGLGDEPAILLRTSIVAQLGAINHALLASEEITALFGEPVELYVEEGVREPVTSTPAAYQSGATFDIALRYAQVISPHTNKLLVPMGDKTGLQAQTDYYEHLSPLNSAARTARRNRRAFYWIMRGALTHSGIQFRCDPAAWYRWSYGDMLWAALDQAPCAYYANLIP